MPSGVPLRTETHLEFAPDAKPGDLPLPVEYVRLEFVERCSCGAAIRWFLWRLANQRGRKPSRSKFKLCADCTAAHFRGRPHERNRNRSAAAAARGNGRLRSH